MGSEDTSSAVRESECRLIVLTLALSGPGRDADGAARPAAAADHRVDHLRLALLLVTRIGAGSSYPTDALPIVVLIGLGIPPVTPAITAAVLGRSAVLARCRAGRMDRPGRSRYLRPRAGWQCGQRKEERFMNGSRRIGRPQRGQGRPSRP